MSLIHGQLSEDNRTYNARDYELLRYYPEFDKNLPNFDFDGCILQTNIINDGKCLCVFHLNPKNFTLVYTEYTAALDSLEIHYQKSFKYLHRIDYLFPLPDNKQVIICSDLEWWNSNNNAIVISLMYWKDEELFLKTNVKLLDYPEALHSSDISCIFRNHSKNVVLIPKFKSGTVLIIDDLFIFDNYITTERITINLPLELKLPIEKISSFGADLLFQNTDKLWVYRFLTHQFCSVNELYNKAHSWCCSEDRIVMCSIEFPDVVKFKLIQQDGNLSLFSSQENLTLTYAINHDDVIVQMCISTFEGFRAYILLKKSICVIDLNRKSILVQLNLLHSTINRTMHMASNGQKVICIEHERKHASMFTLTNNTFIEFTLKYLSARLVREMYTIEQINNLCIPSHLQCYLNS